MSTATSSRLSSEGIAQLSDTFGLLADPTRLAIVLACRDGISRPGRIAETLGVSPSLVSHHLRLLRASQMLRSERRGRETHYALADACVRDMLALMIGHVLDHGDSGHEHTAERHDHTAKETQNG